MEAVKGSQLDHCGYPFSGLPVEPPGVRAALHFHHSPVHSSAVVGIPWMQDSQLPNPVPPPFFPYQEGWRAVSPSGSRLFRGDQGAAGSLGAPLFSVLLGQGSVQHAPGPAFYEDAPSQSATVCTAIYDPLGQSRSTSDHTLRAPPWGSVVGWRKLPVTRPTNSFSSHVVGHPCLTAGARSTRHTQPPTRANHGPLENDTGVPLP